ncbi:MAG: putative ABC transporter ATP-binding protein YbhF [Alphaproteobacteria bacterium MarineAlpha9_Bin1]|nr:MAG: putative ABC transporter ATP-binding protein YbhF [Alphaproteobacteria bacterium MarineAlpha9_Bin1]
MLIKVNQLTKKFGPFTAVENISFNLDRGEVLGFLGPNGAGKTTTMRMITGFLSPSSGDVLISNLNIQEFPLSAKKQIGYVPEGAPLYGEMTVLNFLKFIFSLRKNENFNDDKSIYIAIDKLGLEKVLYQQIETLSKGYKRRVGLAQAILHDPDILILDEPTDGLDPNQKHEVRRLITEMSSDKAIIISTHILEEVDAVCTRAMIISNGKMIIDKSPNELLKLGKQKDSTLDDVFRELTLGEEGL